MTSIKRNLAHYLVRINSLELMAEKIRQKIADNPYFQVQTVFQRIDKFRKGYIVPDDLSEFMLQNKLYPTQIELYLIFRDFDKERVGVVTLQRLTQQLLPKQHSKLRTKALERKYYEPGFRLEIDLEYIIAKLFQHKIRQINQLSKIRLQMNENRSYVVEEAFTLIDYQKKGTIESFTQIDSFLRNNGKVLTKDQLLRIFRVLSFDKESPILYETFSEQLDPLGKGYYIGYSQRITEKNLIQQEFIRKKIQLKSQTSRQSRQNIVLTNTLADLQIRNNRLQDLIIQQSNQQRMRQQQLYAFKRMRNLL